MAKSGAGVSAPAIMPRSSMVAEKLRKDIRDGHYRIGQKLSNENALAVQFGINRGTVRKALKILEEERLITRRHGHGTFVTDPNRPQPTGSRVSLIGAMVWEKEYYFGAVLDGAFSQSASRGYVLTTASNASSEAEHENVEAFVNSGIRGLVLAPRQYSRLTYETLQKANIPVVMIDTVLPGLHEDFVSVNNAQGIELATEHLIKLGHTKIAYIGSNDKDDIPNTPSRLEGFVNTCRRYDLEIRRSWLVEVGGFPEEYLPILRGLLDTSERPTAIVSFSDIWAIRIIQVARELGLDVPKHLSVTGFDNAELSRTNSVPVTTINPEPKEVGLTAINMLIERIEASSSKPKRSIHITPTLIIRDSTATA